MKLSVTFLFGAMLVLRCVPANAGNIQIGLLDGDQFWSWNCGSPTPPAASQAKPDCGEAKYGETSSCPTVVVSNESSEEVRVELQVSGSGFESPPNGFGGTFFGGSQCNQRTIDRCSNRLPPGHSCYQDILFSPRDSGVSRGRIEVRVTGSGDPVTRWYALKAIADYPPELAAADKVRKAHLHELMRIPHVAQVSLDDSEGDIAIDVEVAHEEDVPKVERQVPPRLGMYRVEVTPKLVEGWAL